MSFPSLAARPGLALTYVGYAIFAALSFVFVKALITETRDRDLEDIRG